MSVVIVGGNECMIREYKELCREYQCKAKVYPKMSSALKNIGSPDLLVLFTSTISHKMVRCALSETKGRDTRSSAPTPVRWRRCGRFWKNTPDKERTICRKH